MKKLVFIFLPFLTFSAVASAGSITISVTDNLILAAPEVAGGATTGSACVTPYLGAQNCVNSYPFSNSSSAPFGTAQSSAAAPGAYDSSYRPFTLSAQGQLVGAYPGAESSTVNVFSYGGNFNRLSVFPSINLGFAPNGADAVANVSASQTENDFLAEDAFILLSVNLSGTSSGSFTLDSATGAMNLTSSGGVSGKVLLSASGVFCEDCFPPQPRIGSGADLIDFRFMNGVVTASSNSLGLALPGIGSSANFALTSVSPFGYTFPVITTPGFGLVFDNFSGRMTNTISQDANLVAPEPGAFFLTLAGLGVLIRRCGRR